jgi:hypothetical protein
MKIHITDFGDSLLWIIDAEEIGLNSPPYIDGKFEVMYIDGKFEVIDEKKFFLSVIKYGIKYEEASN